MQTQSVDQLVGQTLGNYRVERLLAQGRSNAVYLAQHRKTGSVDALTLYLIPRRFSAEAHKRFLMRFRKEATAVISLRHPHILPVYEHGEQDGCPYLVTPYMMHGSLADILRQEGRYEHSEVVPLLEQLIEGLGYAHSNGFIHGTLRPSNIVLSENRSLQVAGFGLMHMLQLSGIEARGEQAEEPYTHLLSVAETFLAAPGYIAPEVVEGQAIDIRSDIYALGCILFELLSGRPPFEGRDPLEVARQHVTQTIPSLRTVSADVPIALAAVVNQSLEHDPNRRFQSVQELGEAFAQASYGAQGKAARTRGAERQQPATPARPDRVQETPRDGLNRWQLLPPIVTGKQPVITPNMLERSTPTSARGNTSSQTAVTIPPRAPEPILPEAPRQISRPSVPVQKEPTRSETAGRREIGRSEPPRPEPPMRREVPPQEPPMRREKARPEAQNDDLSQKSMVGEDPAVLIKNYAWWSQVGDVSLPAVGLAKKQSEQATPPREMVRPRSSEISRPATEPVRRTPAAQQPLETVDWTMEPMLPDVVSSRVRMAGSASPRPQKKVSRRRIVALLAGGGVAAAGVAVALNLNKFMPNAQTGAQTANQQGGQTGSQTTNQTGGNGTQQTGVIGTTQQPAKGTSVAFKNPADGKDSLLIHLPDDTFVAYERACTHVGVFVNYDANLNKLVCPAHGAIFDPTKGAAVDQGPATTPLPTVKVKVNNDGTISAL
jgi:serine/threonine protein kinase/Rieske Fe-S protein